MHYARFGVVSDRLELEFLLLPPTGRLRNRTGHDAAEGLREFVVIGRACARSTAARAVKVVEKKFSFVISELMGYGYPIRLRTRLVVAPLVFRVLA